MLGPPLPLAMAAGALREVVGSGTAPIWMAYPENPQFVGQLPEFPTLRGRPLVMLYSPETCQPPITASISLEFERNRLPLPNGSWNTAKPLTECCTSKSDTLLFCCALYGLMMTAYDPPVKSLSAFDVR